MHLTLFAEKSAFMEQVHARTYYSLIESSLSPAANQIFARLCFRPRLTGEYYIRVQGTSALKLRRRKLQYFCYNSAITGNCVARKNIQINLFDFASSNCTRIKPPMDEQSIQQFIPMNNAKRSVLLTLRMMNMMRIRISFSGEPITIKHSLNSDSIRKYIHPDILGIG